MSTNAKRAMCENTKRMVELVAEAEGGSVLDFLRRSIDDTAGTLEDCEELAKDFARANNCVRSLTQVSDDTMQAQAEALYQVKQRDYEAEKARLQGDLDSLKEMKSRLRKLVRPKHRALRSHFEMVYVQLEIAIRETAEELSKLKPPRPMTGLQYRSSQLLKPKEDLGVAARRLAEFHDEVARRDSLNEVLEAYFNPELVFAKA